MLDHLIDPDPESPAELLAAGQWSSAEQQFERATKQVEQRTGHGCTFGLDGDSDDATFWVQFTGLNIDGVVGEVHDRLAMVLKAMEGK